MTFEIGPTIGDWVRNTLTDRDEAMKVVLPGAGTTGEIAATPIPKTRAKIALNLTTSLMSGSWRESAERRGYTGRVRVVLSSRKVTSGGRITIPKEIRDQLKLKPGDQIDFERNRDGGFRLKVLSLPSK
jgi:AbrB family looped-hinge helix DNA binding protein